MSRRTRSAVFVVAGLLAAGSAYLAYPLYFDQNYKGFSPSPPTIIVFQDGSLGNKGLVVTVVIADKSSGAQLQLDQLDVTGTSEPGAATFVGLEYQESGYSFRYKPIDCTADTTGGPAANVGTADPSGLWKKGTSEGTLGGVPDTTGQVTSIRLKKSITTVKIRCSLPDFGFARESLAQWNLFLPGVETHALGGALRPVPSYSVARDPSDYLSIASEQPSEVLAKTYTWYERDHDLFARQGLYLTTSSPSLQQESAYRLFVAGALVGLAGALMVAGIQAAVDRS